MSSAVFGFLRGFFCTLLAVYLLTRLFSAPLWFYLGLFVVLQAEGSSMGPRIARYVEDKRTRGRARRRRTKVNSIQSYYDKRRVHK